MSSLIGGFSAVTIVGGLPATSGHWLRNSTAHSRRIPTPGQVFIAKAYPSLPAAAACFRAGRKCFNFRHGAMASVPPGGGAPRKLLSIIDII